MFGLVSLLLVAGSGLPPQVRPAPVLTATTLEGGEWSEQLTGRVTVVEFFATWCQYCRRSLAGYQWLQETRPVRLIIVDVEEDPALVAAYFTEHPPPTGAGVLVDPTGSARRAWDVKSFPTYFLIDQAGKVRSRSSGWGPGSAEDLAEEIDALRAPPPALAKQEALPVARRDAAVRRVNRRDRKNARSPARPPTHDERARELGVEVLR